MTQSDHKPVICLYSIPSIHCFSIVKYSARKYTRKNEELFVNDLNNTDWSELFASPDANSKVNVLHGRIGLLFDQYFPLKSYSRKSTDAPWVTDHYKKEARKTRLESVSYTHLTLPTNREV